MKKIAPLLTATAAFAAAELLRRPFWGGRPDREDRKDYARRAENYDGKYFVNPEEWALTGIGEDHPLSDAPQRPRHLLPGVRRARSGGDGVTWLGHSTLLITLAGKNILIDPILSRHCAPVHLRGFLRFSRPPIRAEKLPMIDVLLLTHDHYDHLDYPTIRRLRDRVGCFVVPLGVEKHLLRWGVAPERIRALSWWEDTHFDELTVTCTPCRHNSGRTPSHRRTLCCSWVLRDGVHQLYESGDTGWGGHFAAIHERFGDFDLAMLDCAQYNMDWHYSHMFPEESVMAAKALGAKAAMPIHWGAFVLSKHPWNDPPERFVRAAEQEGVMCVTPRLGEKMLLGDWENHTGRWWRGME